MTHSPIHISIDQQQASVLVQAKVRDNTITLCQVPSRDYYILWGNSNTPLDAHTLQHIVTKSGKPGKYAQAIATFKRMVKASEFVNIITNK